MIKNNLNIEDFELDEIIEIEEVNGGDTVDITVSGTHMFFLENGIYTHNSGYNAEIIDMDSIAEAFAKCFPADFICTVSRTAEDKRANTGRTFVAKNRNGSDGVVFNMFMDPSCVDIKILNPATDASPIFKDDDKNKKLERMKKLYQEMKKLKNEGEA